MLRHDDERMRRLTDEAGKYPDTLKGVKPEVPPGPQNEIVLDPRISHMHVSTDRSFCPRLPVFGADQATSITNKRTR
jgi:hypothetical protein